MLNGATYPNVIKVKTKVEIKILNQTTPIDLEYWLAKDVGPIREYTSSNGSIQERTLTNYMLY
ncbi:hypothetical protein H9W95_02810 [Flavobacterium lindanitolerans]|nr:hypothetical protein [Flavobacterium lindanitolerans]